MSNPMIVLPISKDLWIAPTYDEAGNIVPRADTVERGPLAQPATMTPDQMAMLMAQMEAAKNAPKEK